MPEREVTPNRTSKPPRKRSKRGGRRPGSGGKPGNLNALTTGKGSKRVRALRLALQNTDTARLLSASALADESRVVITACSLHYIAELMLITRGINPSNVWGKTTPEQLAVLDKLRRTIRRSNGEDFRLFDSLNPPDIAALTGLVNEREALSMLPLPGKPQPRKEKRSS